MVINTLKFIQMRTRDGLQSYHTAFYGLSILLGLLLGFLIAYVPLLYLLPAIGVLVYIYLLFFRIEYAIMLSLLFMEPLRQLNYLGAGTPFHPNGLIGLAIIVGAIWYFLNNKVDISRLRAHWSFLVFMLVSILSLAFAGDRLFDGIATTLKLVTAYSIYIILLLRLDSVKKIEWLIGAILGTQLWLTISELMRVVGNAGLTFSQGETARLGHSGRGTTLATISILCLVVFLNAKTKKRQLLWGCLTGFFVIGLFYSYGRAGWIGFVFGVIFIGILRHRKILLIIPVLLVIMINYIPALLQRFSDISLLSLRYFKANTLSLRIGFWKAGIEVFKKHPLLGVGFGVEKFRVGEILNYHYPNLHNDYLTVLVGTGVIGFILFMLWFSLWFLELFKVYLQSKIHYARTLALAVLAFFTTSLVVRITDNLLQTTDDLYPEVALVAAALVIPRLISEGKFDRE